MVWGLSRELWFGDINEVLSKGEGYGAVVPTHTLAKYDFKYVIKNVADSLHNETRFIHVGSKREVSYKEDLQASLVLTPLEDRPGVLFSILAMFNGYNFNLKAILSRPRKDEIGKYVFYLELELKNKEIQKLRRLIDSLNNQLLNELSIYQKNITNYNSYIYNIPIEKTKHQLIELKNKLNKY